MDLPGFHISGHLYYLWNYGNNGVVCMQVNTNSLLPYQNVSEMHEKGEEWGDG